MTYKQMRKLSVNTRFVIEGKRQMIKSLNLAIHKQPTFILALKYQVIEFPYLSLNGKVYIILVPLSLCFFLHVYNL